MIYKSRTDSVNKKWLKDTCEVGRAVCLLYREHKFEDVFTERLRELLDLMVDYRRAQLALPLSEFHKADREKLELRVLKTYFEGTVDGIGNMTSVEEITHAIWTPKTKKVYLQLLRLGNVNDLKDVMRITYLGIVAVLMTMLVDLIIKDRRKTHTQ
jgi:hypothetical protein